MELCRIMMIFFYCRSKVMAVGVELLHIHVLSQDDFFKDNV